VGAIRAVTKADPVYPFRAMINMSKIYGPVVGFYLGPRQAFVSVCGYEATKEALLNEDLNARPNLASIRERTFNKRLGNFSILEFMNLEFLIWWMAFLKFWPCCLRNYVRRRRFLARATPLLDAPSPRLGFRTHVHRGRDAGRDRRFIRRHPHRE